MAKAPHKRLPSPPHLPPDAAAIWDEVVAYLDGEDLLHAVDGATIETYALAVVRQRLIAEQLGTGKLVDSEGRINPLLRVAEATAATVKNLGHVLRLNPTARKGEKTTPR